MDYIRKHNTSINEPLSHIYIVNMDLVSGNLNESRVSSRLCCAWHVYPIGCWYMCMEIDFVWRRRQNSVSETLWLKKERTINKVQEHNTCIDRRTWEVSRWENDSTCTATKTNAIIGNINKENKSKTVKDSWYDCSSLLLFLLLSLVIIGHPWNASFHFSFLI
jgi:hypothetical protein